MYHRILIFICAYKKNVWIDNLRNKIFPKFQTLNLKHSGRNKVIFRQHSANAKVPTISWKYTISKIITLLNIIRNHECTEKVNL